MATDAQILQAHIANGTTPEEGEYYIERSLIVAPTMRINWPKVKILRANDSLPVFRVPSGGCSGAWGGGDYWWNW